MVYDDVMESTTTETPTARFLRGLNDRCTDNERAATSARESLAAKAVNSDMRPERLMGELHSVAEFEAKATVFRSAHHRFTHLLGEHGPEGVAERGPAILFSLFRDHTDPDDTWSGRGNDLRRSAAAAAREAVFSVERAFRHSLGRSGE